MKKLLWVSLSVTLFVSACKTKKSTAEDEVIADTAVKEMPLPASDNPKKYDSLKHELNKRRQEKKK